MAKLTTNRLSDRKVKTAKAGKYADGGGLILRVQPTQDGTLSRYWIFRFADRTTGKDRAMGLGNLDTLSLAEARDRARACRQLLLDGNDPIAAKHARRAANATADASVRTFDQCAAAYIATHRAGWSNPKHAKQWETSLADYVSPTLGKLPVDVIDTHHILEVLEPIWTTKAETASRIRGRLESILDWAIARKYRREPNPARWKGCLQPLLPAKADLNKGKVEHHAALPFDLVGQFMPDLRSRPGIAAKALEFVILTASRSAEALEAQWSEFDLKAATWTIPGPRMKGRVEHVVPLSEPVMAILRAMQPRTDAHGYVFPGRKNGHLGPLALQQAIQGVNADRQKAGLPAYVDPRQGNRTITTHGMRSCFKDWASETTHYPADLTEACLAHQTGSEVERAYRRGAQLEKRRRVMASWAEYCGRPVITGADVIPMKRSISNG
jgi:integrase